MRIGKRRRMWLLAVASVVSLPGADCAGQAPPANAVAQRGPAYQRNRQSAVPYGFGNQQEAAADHLFRAPNAFGDPTRQSHRSRMGPAVAASGTWFQRPYPYHLDYYRMRYGGTYEPYYGGGLYGTPQVIGTPAYGYGYGYGQPPPFGYAPGPAMGYVPATPANPSPDAAP